MMRRILQIRGGMGQTNAKRAFVRILRRLVPRAKRADSQDNVSNVGTRMIYSCESKAEGVTLEVPLQREFIGRYDVLTSKEADTLLTDLGTQGILNRMNAIFGTTRILSSATRTLLQFCLDTFTDFGQAYSILRPRWKMDPSIALEDIKFRKEKDQRRRLAAMENDIVVDSECPPRRLWDLASNRVVPFWVTCFYDYRYRSTDWYAVSHSWMAEDLRQTVESPINGREWPIPIPTDTSLECIRIELLNLLANHANYVWLDVLCLRQIGHADNEELRQEEWKLDVPAIGPVYKRAQRVVYYLSGLGRPFEASGLDSPRHWKNRAWTLQEITVVRVIAGRSPNSPSMPDDFSTDLPVDGAIKPLHVVFRKGDKFDTSASTFEVLDLMRHRSATSELDKIAGLIFFFTSFKPPLPAYIVGEDPGLAWDRLIEATDQHFRAELFFFFPEPGKGKHAWYPSWQQIKETTSLPNGYRILNEIGFDRHSNTYTIRCRWLDCFLTGLSEVDGHGDSSRWRGSMLVEGGEGNFHKFAIAVHHPMPVPDGNYTLLADYFLENWVVSRKVELEIVEKVSVIEVDYWDSSRSINLSALIDIVNTDASTFQLR